MSSLTLDKLREAEKKLMGSSMIYGIPIFSNRFVPKEQPRKPFQLSHKLNLSYAFRQSFDSWAIEMFGGEPLIYETKEGYIAHPETVAKLKAAIDDKA